MARWDRGWWRTRYRPGQRALRAYVNGELRQTGTPDLIFKVAPLIEYISEFMTLEQDDVILTGTPEGICYVYPGDVLKVEAVDSGRWRTRSWPKRICRPVERRDITDDSG